MKQLQRIRKTKGFKFYTLSLLVFVLAATLVAVPVLAASTFNLAGMEGSQSGGDKEWTTSATGAEIILTSTFEDGGQCGSDSVSGQTSATMTLTNNSGASAEVSFSASMTTNGTLKINGNAVTSYSSTMANGDSITIVASSPTSTDIVTSGSKDYTAKIFDVSFVPNIEANLTLTGDMTATLVSDGSAMEMDTSYLLTGEDSVTLTATPEDGMMLSYWMINDVPYTRSDTITWNPTTAGDFTIEPHYMPEGTPLFTAGSNIYDDLGEAMTDVASVITVAESGTLPESESYTVPKGKTLLVPKAQGDDGEFEYIYGLYSLGTYVTLDVPETTSITVDGTLTVGGTQTCFNTNNVGISGNTWGQIDLTGDIIINSGATLNAYGYIEGDGMVTIKSGAKSYEYLQMSSFQGGSLTNEIYKNTFPMNFYYIQNVQTDFKVESGATLYAHWAVYMGSTNFNGIITYMDNSTSSQSMFHLTSGHMIRTFDPNTYRMSMDLYGAFSTGSIEMTVKYIFSVTIDSADVELPLPGNMGLNIKDGGKFTVNDKIKLLPGVNITIDDGGEMVLGSGGKLYAYHSDDYDSSSLGYSWNKFNLMVRSEDAEIKEGIAVGTIANAKSGYYFDWGDTKIVNNGVITYDGGNLYTSASEDGSTITGTGVMDFSNDTTTTTTITEYTFNGGETTGTHSVPFSRPVLNVDGTATSSVKGTTYAGTTDGIWYTTNGTLSITENTTATLADNQIAVDVVLTPEYSVSDGTFAVTVGYANTDLSLVSGTSDISVTGLSLEAGEEYLLQTLVFDILDTCDGTVDIEVGDGTWTLDGYDFLTTSTENYTYYPTYTISYDQAVQSDWVTSYTVNSDDFTLPVLSADSDGNAFLGWYVGEDKTVFTSLDFSQLAGDLTLTAVWDVTKHYTITFSDGVTSIGYTNKDTGAITLPIPSKTGYTFGGWYEAEGTEALTEIAPSSAKDYTLTAKWTAITYTISFSDDVAAVTYTVEDNTITLPVLADTETHTFGGWYEDDAAAIMTTIEPSAVKDYTLTAKWTEIAITPEPEIDDGKGDGSAPTTGDTIEVVVTPSAGEELEETVSLNVTIIANDDVANESDEMESTGYNALAEDTKMIVLSTKTEDETITPEEPSITETTDEDGNTYVDGYCYDGQPMYYSPLYGGYVYIYDETEGFDASKVTAGEAIVLEYNGDIYDDGEVTAFDVSRIYRLAMGQWSDGYDVVDMKSRLEADLNGDGVVNVDDALYILQQLWDQD